MPSRTSARSTTRSRTSAGAVAVILFLAGSALPAPGTTRGPQFSASAPAFPDFNGDGYADLAVGDAGEDVGTLTDAGAVEVLYGSPAGLQSQTPADQQFTQDSPGVPDVAEAVDEFGSGLVAGDFNGDGLDDLAIGAGSEDVGASSGAGSVTILYGSPNGLQTTDPPAALLVEGSGGVPGTADPKDFFGDHLAAGDLNGDGTDDLLVGVKRKDVGGIVDAGSLVVVYGSPAGPGGGQASSAWNEGSPGVPDDPQAGEGFGTEVAAGDLNGDGFDDAVVGVPDEGLGGVSRGAVFVLYGSPSGIQTSDPAAAMWTQDSPGVKGVAQDGERFGASLATGDFNGDGRDDLAAGVPGELVRGAASAGAVAVLYGGAAGLQASMPDDQLWSQASPGVPDRPERFDRFGQAVAAGDFNGDGRVDLAADAPGECKSSGCGGAATVLYGSSNGLQAASPGAQEWSQDSPGIKDSAEGSSGPGDRADQFGHRMEAADFNGDGSADLAAGVPGEDLGGVTDAGAVAVIYGSAAGLQANAPNDQLWSQGRPGVEDDPEPHDEFGTRLP